MGVLNDKIIERMEAKNLSISKLERLAGLRIHSVRNILKGRIKKPSAQTLQAIAQALECSIIDLMSETSSEIGVFDCQISLKNKPILYLDDPGLLLECCKVVMARIMESHTNLTVEDSLQIIKKVYLYSSRGEPKKVDLKFVNWVISDLIEETR